MVGVCESEILQKANFNATPLPKNKGQLKHTHTMHTELHTRLKNNTQTAKHLVHVQKLSSADSELI